MTKGVYYHGDGGRAGGAFENATPFRRTRMCGMTDLRVPCALIGKT